MDAYWGAPYPAGGLLWVLEHNGVPKRGFPKSLPGQTIWSSPAVVDLTGNGRLDIIVGTGLNWPNPAGRKLYAFDRNGNHLPGWPQTIYNGRVMSSPAVGNLLGDSRPEIAVLADDGRINVYDAGGVLRWSRCNVDSTSGCRSNYGTHGSVSIADVDNDGQAEVVSQAEHWMRVFDGATGNQEDQAVWGLAWAPASAPTIAEVGGQTWIVQTATSNTWGDGKPGLLDTAGIYVWTTSTPLGTAEWPTFKKNMRRAGTYVDDTAPVATVDALGPSQGATPFTVSFSGTDSGTGITRFLVDVMDAGGSWVRWLDISPDSRVGDAASASRSFFGVLGQAYKFRVRAIDGASNRSARSVSVTTSVNAGAVSNRPFDGAYSVSRRGRVTSYSSPPADGPNWSWNIAAGLATLPDGSGGYVVDGWGGLHPFGAAPRLGSTGFWPGWNIVRGIALNADGRSGYKLDGWGGLHRIGNAVPVSNGPHWTGWDIAVDVVLTASSTAARPAGYILDAWGGIHRFGSAPPLATRAYWPGWRIARAFDLDPEGPGGYVLDGWGGLHRFGGAKPSTSHPYWRGWNIARDVSLIADGDPSTPRGYVLDGFGGVHRVNGAPAVASDDYWGYDTGWDLDIAP